MELELICKQRIQVCNVPLYVLSHCANHFVYIVIIFDSDWNPHQDLQAVSRAHRLGQKSEVKVYRLITRNSVESVLFERAMTKLQLSNMILKGEYADSEEATMSEPAHGKSSKDKEAIMADILKSGTVSILTDEDQVAEMASMKFIASSIDKILETDVDNVKYVEGSGYVLADSAAAISASNTSRSVFAKAVFLPNTADLNPENAVELGVN